MWPPAYVISQIIAQVQVFHHFLLGGLKTMPVQIREQYSISVVLCSMLLVLVSHILFQYMYYFSLSFVSLCTASDLMPGKHVNLLDPNLIYKVTQKYNDSLKFDPSEPKMAFTTRDPVRNGKSFISK